MDIKLTVTKTGQAGNLSQKDADKAQKKEQAAKLNVNEGEQLAAKIADNLKSNSADTTSIKNNSATGAILSESNTNLRAQSAADAAGAINDARQKQLDLANEAKISDPERQETLNTEVAALETEVSRIASAATVDGANTLTGGTYAVGDDGTEVVSIPDLSSLATPLALDVSSLEGATSAISELETAVSAGSQLASGANSAASKANSFLAKRTESYEVQLDTKALDEESATKLAEKVAKELQDKLNVKNDGGSTDVNQLIEATTKGLEPEKVKRLLED